MNEQSTWAIRVVKDSLQKAEFHERVQLIQNLMKVVLTTLNDMEAEVVRKCP